MELEDLDFSDEGRQEARELFGRPIYTWEEVQDWDDVVTPEEKRLTSRLKDKSEACDRCPYFAVKGEHFNYCRAKADRYARGGYPTGDSMPSNNSSERHSKLDHFELQLWCLGGEERYSKCVQYKEAEKLEK